MGLFSSVKNRTCPRWATCLAALTPPGPVFRDPLVLGPAVPRWASLWLGEWANERADLGLPSGGLRALLL